MTSRYTARIRNDIKEISRQIETLESCIRTHQEILSQLILRVYPKQKPLSDCCQAEGAKQISEWLEKVGKAEMG